MFSYRPVDVLHIDLIENKFDSSDCIMAYNINYTIRSDEYKFAYSC